ncbi:unnamed protein product [Trichobilharzia szidati]|nr:unnamed protein product [Trichobilharzia szidati]
MHCLKLKHLLSSHINPFIMNNKIITVKDASLNLSSIVQLLNQGGVIALPTDTIYGLACSVYNTEAIERICRIKGRSETKPMAICLDQVSNISHWCDTKHIPCGLLSDLLPGPVTVLLPRYGGGGVGNVNNKCQQDPLNPRLNPTEKRVGVRIPDSGFIRKLISALHGERKQSDSVVSDNGHDVGHGSGGVGGGGHPLVLTSANLSGQKSALQIEEFSELWPSIDLIINGGPIQTSLNSDCNRAGSTIVDLCQCDQLLYSIIRDGSALDSTVDILEGRYHLTRTNS